MKYHPKRHSIRSAVFALRKQVLHYERPSQSPGGDSSPKREPRRAALHFPTTDHHRFLLCKRENFYFRLCAICTKSGQGSRRLDQSGNHSILGHVIPKKQHLDWLPKTGLFGTIEQVFESAEKPRKYKEKRQFFPGKIQKNLLQIKNIHSIIKTTKW